MRRAIVGEALKRVTDQREKNIHMETLYMGVKMQPREYTGTMKDGGHRVRNVLINLVHSKSFFQKKSSGGSPYKGNLLSSHDKMLSRFVVNPLNLYRNNLKSIFNTQQSNCD